jgi:DNA polymerase
MAYPPNKLVKFDFETRSDLDLPKVGTYAYATHPSTAAIILTYQLTPDLPVVLIQKMGRALTWDDFPQEFKDAYADPEVKFVAFNTPFDRAIWNYTLVDAPYLPPERTLDAMAQAMSSNLPASLDQASKALGGPPKLSDGKLGIALFSATGTRTPRKGLTITGIAWPKDFPEEWSQFCTYAVHDTAVLGYIWKHTRELPEREWRVFWANEALCERGMGVDLEFCAKAAVLAKEAAEEAGKELHRLTEGALWSVNQHVAIAQWVYDRLPNDEARDIMTTDVIEPEERDENDEQLPALIKISIARRNVERLLDWYKATKQNDTVLKDVLELREFGASAAPKKYAAALLQQSGGRLRGQITFMGAAQTGRFSGKGVQPQNLTRTPLGPPGDDYGTWEAPTVDLITEGCTLDQLNGHGDGEVALRKLALLVRPSIIAPEGRTLIKADYSQVEARGCPWLANSPEADKLLQYFRDVDADPSLPDLYVISAAGMLKKKWQDVTKAERQTGKVASLACQFQGSVGALTSMAANYRMYIPPGDAKIIVDQWRAANPWAPRLWGRHNQHESYGLIGAAMRAYNSPRTPQKAGRIAFSYEPTYLGGSLFMRLPSGRLLTYPWCKFREYEVKDKKTGKVTEVRKGLTFKRPVGMRAIYGGLLCENATQATCADLLREALVVLNEGLLGPKLDVVLHAHDEIVVECDDNRDTIRKTLEALEGAMTFDREWAKGFPLAVDSVVRFYYSAAKLKEAA